MTTKEEAEKAKTTLNLTEIDGKKIEIKEEKLKWVSEELGKK